MKDLILTVDADSRKVTASKGFFGITGEHLYGNIIFDFKDEFVDGTAYLEIDTDTPYIVEMEKTEHRYSAPIKSSLLSKTGIRKVQLKVVTPIDAENSSIFKSEIFMIPVLEAVNAGTEAPDDYPTWEEEIQAGLGRLDAELDDLDEKVESGYFNGAGVPAGGSAGQVLKKASATDYDTEWLSVDTTPTSGSSNLITSGAVYSAIVSALNTSV